MPKQPQQCKPVGIVPVVVLLFCTFPAMQTALSTQSIEAASYQTDNSDALVFRASAELLLLGRSPYDLKAQAEHIRRTRLSGVRPPYTLPFAYPPNALPLFLIYGIGPPRAGLLLFVLSTTLLMLLGLDRMATAWGFAESDRLLLLMAAGISGALLYNAHLGQTGACLGALAFLYAACYQRRPALAGLCLGLLCFKPQYAVFFAALPLAERRFRLLAGAALTLLLCTLVSGALFGFGLWADFVRAVVQPNPTIPFMVNWFGPIVRSVPATAQVLPHLGIPLLILSALALGPACLWLLRRGNHARLCLGLSASCAVLLGPNTHPYDLTLWTLPLCALLPPGARLPAWAAVLLASIGELLLMAPSRRLGLTLASIGILALCAYRAGIAGPLVKLYSADSAVRCIDRRGPARLS